MIFAEEHIQKLLRRAALFQHLAGLVSEPDAELKERVVNGFQRLDPIGEPQENGSQQENLFVRTRRAWEQADPDKLRTDYARLFLLRSPHPLNETAYGEGRRLAGRENELADINGFYRAFGVEVSKENPDLPDHLTTELEFYSTLLMKVAYAESLGLFEEAEITLEANKAFLEDHLGRWVGALCREVNERKAPSPYPESLSLIESVVAAECGFMGAKPSPLTEPLAQTPLDKEPLTCPLAGSGRKK